MQRSFGTEINIQRARILSAVEAGEEKIGIATRYRPEKLTRRQKRLLLRIVRKNPRIDYAALKYQVAGITVQHRTLQRLFKKHHITKWLAKKRPKLTLVYDGRSELITIERDVLARKDGYSARSYIWALEEETHGVWTLDFPPYSPDLNPIEHLWLALKRKILELYPELEQMGQSKEDLERLIKACKEAWLAIDQGLMRRLIDTRGWQTRY
ncbi:uncharacterized protein K441DRAFT_658869 [Cenococcum geophilum 1.58]|uniref:uncharacterized protein n=1 Tax=Cenococcum geophilum 1.58 TaxID=794803 RepID=UPI00358F2A6D|nr:hypothetical protein K441DRAFT_658869 [Cenococcum geophilum 1.58]